MDIPITHTIMITATTLMATFPSIMISMVFIVSMVVTTRLTIGEEDTDPYFLKGHNEGTAFLALLLVVLKKGRILIRWRHIDEIIKIRTSEYIH
jgi:hypothetical protein